MNRTILATICSIALALAAFPHALGAWSANGGIEPDYAQDAASGLMFPDPDISPADGHRQVYFNVVKTPGGSGVNPNVGALGSHTGVQAQAQPSAFLGVWKDCNHDGYIGMAETAVMEYASTLLTTQETCPDGGLFNANGWVYEFIWIIDGAVGDENERPARYIDDRSVKVWGDSGLPPQSAPGAGGSDNDCFINPPHGTFSSTGGMLDYADCLTGHTVTSTVNDIDEQAQLGIGFGSDDNPQCSSSPLNQRLGLYGPSPECPDRYPGYVGLMERYEDHEHATFTVWDCESAPAAEGVPGGVAPRVGETPGSAYEAANETYARCGTSSAPRVVLESDVEQSVAKVTNDYVLQYYALLMTREERTADGLLHEDTPQTGGSYLGIALLAGPTYWEGTGTTNAGMVQLVETRDDGGLDGEGPDYDTFYASVSAPGLILPGGSGVYGAEWCGSDFTTPRVLGGYDCAADHWYNAAHGASAMPTNDAGRPLGALPGEAYNLRDVDCYDGSVAGQHAPGVGAGLTLLDSQPDEEGRSTGPCPQS